MFYWKNHVFIPYPHPLPQVCFLDHSFPSLPINCCSTNGCTSAKINKNPEISNHPSTKNSKFISRFHPFRGKDSIISFYMGDEANSARDRETDSVSERLQDNPGAFANVPK